MCSGRGVLDGSVGMPPVAFTPAQAVATDVALSVLPPGSRFGIDARATAGKVLDTLGTSLRARTAALARRVWVLRDEAEQAAPPRVLRALEQSLVAGVALAITYRQTKVQNQTGRRADHPGGGQPPLIPRRPLPVS